MSSPHPTEANRVRLTDMFGLEAKQAAVVAAFGVYLAVIVCFAIGYHARYRRRPTSFLFALDLTAARLSELRPAAEKEFAAAAELRAFADALVTDQGANHLEARISYATVTSPDGTKMHLHTAAELFGGRAAVDVVITQGQRQCKLQWAGRVLPRTDADINKILSDLVSFATTRYETASRRIAALDDVRSVRWGFGDFLYFSVITQSTVGYGDILPNDSMIRRAVATQVLVGYAIVVVVINVLLLA
jgi:hypothetical protein